MKSKLGTLALTLSVSLAATAQMQTDSTGAVYNINSAQLDREPEFPGGLQALTTYVRENIVYPDNAFEENIEGIVNVIFTIDTLGNVKNPEVESNIGNVCEHAALEVISKMPAWKPAIFKGKPVPVLYRMPVHFFIPDKLPEHDDDLYSKEPVYRHTQVDAEYPGGKNALSVFIKQQIPELNTDNAGNAALIEFIIGAQGEVRKIALLKSLNDTDELEYKLDDLKKVMPEWKPAIANNSKVTSYYQLPVKDLSAHHNQ